MKLTWQMGLFLLLGLSVVGGSLCLMWYMISPVPVKISMQTNAELLAERKPKFEVQGSELSYYSGAKGFFVEPVQKGDYPGIVMVHEWWGVSPFIRQMAEQLAGQGYRVLAVDLFHGEVATSADRARELVGSLKQDEATKNLRAAVSYLHQHDAKKVGTIGWCFGGGQVLQLSLSGEPLDASVIYYGQLTDDVKRLQAMTWPVLGIFGDKDQAVTPESVVKFENALNIANVAHEIHTYPNVGHAFANPSGATYSPEASRDAWDKTLTFLEKSLH